ncbi:MAG: N-acetylglucosamine-6-phosphate deacetylase [Anaerolineae bacterium]|nr:N-acetylglucosamine-6-phosphate deacetylase [Anaerolineae bacterium]NUQ02408.1 N-acetylglucosamine-6-phosphate deacetylase [Anaerolineae bacterium]
MLITNARIITPAGEMRWMSIRNGIISALGMGEPQVTSDTQIIDAQGMTVLPGFIDVHFHGAAGHDVMDATPEALEGMAVFSAQHGVTGFLATTLTNPREALTGALENVRACVKRPVKGARLLGARLEGPYLNVEKCGAQNPEYIRTAAPDEALAFLDLGVLRMVDVAPEIAQNEWLLDECVRRGITVSIAHTSATAADVVRAAARGATQSTHTFNAQTPLHHREPGVVGAVLALPEIRCELIADGVHVHPLAMRIVWMCKKPDRLILISDAVRAAGMPDGEYSFDERKVLLKDGAVRLPDGTLAGSCLTMDRALRMLMGVTGEPIESLWQTASLNPARALGIADRKGSLEVGKDADLTVVTGDLNVHLTMVEGQIVYRIDS